MNKVKDQAIIELREIIDDQKILYSISTKKILQNNDRISKQINDINKLKVKFYQVFVDVIKNYLHVVCLFALKQATKELKIINPKKLSINIKSWINAISQTITNKYLMETNQRITLPVIDNIDRGLAVQELVYRVNLLFDQIKLTKPDIIISGLEGKALFRGRDLAVKLFNKDIKLEAEGFLAASLKETLLHEKVVAVQWSAILDTHVCELCASLDGKIINIEDPEYTYYSPGDLHIGCRCLWIYIKSSERPENRVITWVSPSKILIKKYANPFVKDASKTLKRGRVHIKSLSKLEQKKVLKDINKQIEIKLEKNVTLNKNFKDAIKNERFKTYIVDQKHLKGLNNIRYLEDHKYSGTYYYSAKAITIDAKVSQVVLNHEIGHHIGMQPKNGFMSFGPQREIKWMDRTICSDKVKTAYLNSINNYANNLSGSNAKKIKKHLLKVSNEAKKVTIRYNTAMNVGEYADSYNDNVGKAIWNGKGAISEYSLKNPNEYIAEGIGNYIANPNALKDADLGLFNLIDDFFGGNI